MRQLFPVLDAGRGNPIYFLGIILILFRMLPESERPVLYARLGALLKVLGVDTVH